MEQVLLTGIYQKKWVSLNQSQLVFAFIAPLFILFEGRPPFSLYHDSSLSANQPIYLGKAFMYLFVARKHARFRHSWSLKSIH